MPPLLLFYPDFYQISQSLTIGEFSASEVEALDFVHNWSRDNKSKKRRILDEEGKDRYFQGQITSRPSESGTREQAFTFFIIPFGYRGMHAGVDWRLAKAHPTACWFNSDPIVRLPKGLMKQAGATGRPSARKGLKSVMVLWSGNQSTKVLYFYETPLTTMYPVKLWLMGLQ